MPELDTTLPAWDQENPPEITDAELEAYFQETIAGETRQPAAGETRPVCPACEAGDHEHSWITERDYRCSCPCHTSPEELRELRIPLKPAAIDYERLGFELATATAYDNRLASIFMRRAA